MIDPPLVTRWLLGDGVAGAGLVWGRVAGFGSRALGLACWPGPGTAAISALRAMLTYNLLVTLYLRTLGLGGERVGGMLWPATVLHAVLTCFLARAWWRNRWTRTMRS